MEEMKARQS